MARPPKEPLRSLSAEERTCLEQISRAQSESAAVVIRAKLILAVCKGACFTEAARSVGRRSGDAVAALVCRFNREGLPALTPRHGGGPKVVYGESERARILAEFTRTPDRETDGTATWSKTTLQRALRRAPGGLAKISTYTILQVLHEAGYTWQRDRTWCRTGRVLRRRKAGVVEVSDADAEAKRGAHPARLPGGRSRGARPVERG
jgi:transposase